MDTRSISRLEKSCRTAASGPSERGTKTCRRRRSMASTSASAHASTVVSEPNGPGSARMVFRKLGRSCIWSRTRSVSIHAGCATPTSTPLWASSSRSALPKNSTPALDAAYVEIPGMAASAAADETSRR